MLGAGGDGREESPPSASQYKDPENDVKQRALSVNTVPAPSVSWASMDSTPWGSVPYHASNIPTFYGSAPSHGGAPWNMPQWTTVPGHSTNAPTQWYAPEQQPIAPETLMPAGSTLGRAERRLRDALSAAAAVLRALGSVAQMLDSTVYAAWSSVAALVAIGQHIRSFREEHIGRWFRALHVLASRLIGAIKQNRISSEVESGGVIPANEAAKDAAMETNRGTNSAYQYFARTLATAALPLAAAGAAYVLGQWLLAPKSDRVDERAFSVRGLARAVASFTASHENMLSIDDGDDLFVIQPANINGFVLVRSVHSGAQGFVPATHIMPVSSHS